MLLAEALGVDAFRERVKIYATDVDEEALAQARHAVVRRARGRGCPGAAAGAVLRPAGRPVRLQQGPPARGHLRPARPDPGCPDLAGGPAHLPQLPDVLQHRGPGADPRPVPFRAGAPRRTIPGQGGDAAGPERHVRAGGREAAPLRQDRAPVGEAAPDLRDPERARRHPPTCATPRATSAPWRS